MAIQKDKAASTTTIHALNQLLRGELAAVETYNQALAAFTDDAAMRSYLEEIQTSHARRVIRLRAEILQRGGEAAQESGPWGLFAKVVEGGAKTLGPKMAISALEAGEDHGLKEYKEALPQLDLMARGVVSTDFYLQQMHTHDVLSMMKKRMSRSPTARFG